MIEVLPSAEQGNDCWSLAKGTSSECNNESDVAYAHSFTNSLKVMPSEKDYTTAEVSCCHPLCKRW